MDFDIDAEFALARIRELNDECRRYLPDGRVVFSQGADELPTDDQAAILDRVRTFDDFRDDTDPYGEHDFGAFTYDGEQIFWRIDYYDRDGEQVKSPAPSDPGLTTRVLTVLLASEY